MIESNVMAEKNLWKTLIRNNNNMNTDNQKSIKYVYVTHDPLYEEVVCVHEKQDSWCKKCRALKRRRKKINSPYLLETVKLKLQP